MKKDLKVDYNIEKEEQKKISATAVGDSQLGGIVEPLLAWYDAHARVLPWREQPTPYRVWVSEIMLQQTRVEAVKPYFERFMTALPGIRDLAEAPEDQILKLWEGLGYYNRVRNMQKAAQKLTAEYDGEMPADFEAILDLPGIGSYTAGAIASIAFGLPYPAVDGNVLRVLSRIEKSYDDILKQSVKRRFEQEVKAVIPAGRAGDFTQSLIELGAIVCVPNGAPRCGECPLAAFCQAHQEGVETELPKKTPPKSRRIQDKTVLVLVSDNQAALRKRPAKGLLAGLYELPNLEGHLKPDQVLDYVKEAGLSPIRIQELPAAKHIFSHIEWHMEGYVVKVEEPEQQGNPEKLFFVEKQQMEEKYSIPAAFAAYTEYFKHRY
ncbi:A/G-specific adenine glycosylase [Candidatus Merdisoma sp. HCP28S3_D10]|uniref:A/G-specific adenine glycosylase n=1 Tax=unclassified Candidatus Merdisoma TaxID=3099611 RepID=UPI003F891A85